MLKNLANNISEITEAGAIAAYDFIGKGDEKAADKAATNAMRNQLNDMDIDGTVVIGEGERDNAPMLFIGEKLGKGGIAVDIAVDPLEGTTSLAKGNKNSMAVIAMSDAGGLLHAPDVYMNKIAIGFDFAERLIDLDVSSKSNLQNIASAKKCNVNDLVVTILDRPRHQELISQVKEAGAKIKLISHGDIAGVIGTALSQSDVYMGIGGAPEGVLAAAALKTTGGQICGRLIFSSEEEKSRAHKIGIKDFNKQYLLRDMVRGEVIFSATGITDGPLVSGVLLEDDAFYTETLVINSQSKTVVRVIGRAKYKVQNA